MNIKRGFWLSESRGKNPKRIWRNDGVKATIERKEAAWEEVLRVKSYR